MTATPVRSDSCTQLSAVFPNDTRVLAGRYRYRDNPDPLFSDGTWDLSAAIERPSTHDRRRARVAFSVVTHPSRRLALREFVAARLLKPVPLALKARHLVPNVVTVGDDHRLLLLFFNWLDSTYPGITLTELDDEVYAAYIAHHQARVTPPTVRTYLLPIFALYAYREFLSDDRPTVLPFHGRSATSVSGTVKQKENSTPRIPEAVIAALIRWALFYVDVASNDILAAREEVARLPTQPTDTPRIDDVAKRIDEFVAQRRRSGRGIPARAAGYGLGTVLADPDGLTLGYRNIGQLLGLPRDYLFGGRPRLVRMLQDAVAELGLEAGGLDTPRASHPETELPWRPGWNRYEVLQIESHMLYAACFIVIAYLSGMREDEIQRLKAGCHTISRSANGAIVRHKLRAEVVKGRQGVPEVETWVVVAPVGRAVSIMEQLSPDDFLFSVQMPRTGRTEKPSYEAVWERLRRFMVHVNLVARFHGLPEVPEHGERPWPLSASQFRRTLAFFIARQPFGAVAGKLQYKHLSVVTFEGYAGSSRAGFREEVEEERVMASLDDFVDIYEAVKAGQRVTGPGGTRLTNACLHVREEIGDFPGVVVDETRLRAMLLNIARDVHPGVLNHCWFDPAKALCLRGAEKNVGPILNQCQAPLCANSCVSPLDRVRVRDAISDARRMRRQRGLSPLQQAAIDAQITAMESMTNGGNQEGGP